MFEHFDASFFDLTNSNELLKVSQLYINDNTQSYILSILLLMSVLDSLTMWLKNYKYTAKPEGQDPVGKIGSCLKFTVPFSIMVSGHDIFIQSQCTTLSSACKRLLFWTIPINGMGFIFPTVTLISTRIRGKNDPLNHVMGGM